MDRSPAALKERSLDLHRAVAAKLRADPSLLDKARRTLARWRAEGSHPLWDVWQTVLDQGMDATLAVMSDPSEHGASMRKAAPFPGILTEVERLQILSDWRERHASKS